MRAAVLAAMLLSLISGRATAGVRYVEATEGNNIRNMPHILVLGPIVDADIENFRALIPAAAAAKSRFEHQILVVLNSPGGDVEAAMKLGALMRQANAFVMVGKQCSSACIFLLAAGVNRTIPDDSKIGIHRPHYPPDLFASLNAEDAKALYNRMASRARTYLVKMGMRDELFLQMMGVPSHRVRYLDSEEIDALALNADDPAFAEWSRAQMIKNFGAETVRKLDAETDCLNAGKPLSQCVRR